MTRASKKDLQDLAVATQILEDEFCVNVDDYGAGDIEKMAAILNGIVKLRQKVKWDDREK